MSTLSFSEPIGDAKISLKTQLLPKIDESGKIFEILEEILGDNSDIITLSKTVDNSGGNLLFNAVLHNDVYFAKTLLEKGSSPNFVNSLTGKSCINVAIERGFVNMVKLLFEFHVNPQEISSKSIQETYFFDNFGMLTLLVENQVCLPPVPICYNKQISPQLISTLAEMKVSLTDEFICSVFMCRSNDLVEELFRHYNTFPITDNIFQNCCSFKIMDLLLSRMKTLTHVQLVHLCGEFYSTVKLILEKKKHEHLSVEITPQVVADLSDRLSFETLKSFIHFIVGDIDSQLNSGKTLLQISISEGWPFAIVSEILNKNPKKGQELKLRGFSSHLLYILLEKGYFDYQKDMKYFLKIEDSVVASVFFHVCKSSENRHKRLLKFLHEQGFLSNFESTNLCNLLVGCNWKTVLEKARRGWMGDMFYDSIGPFSLVIISLSLSVLYLKK